MPKIFNDSENYIRLVKNEEREFEGLLIKYSFYEIGVHGMKPQYAIGISTAEEECFVSVGDDRESALFLCEAVISGGVTPCTLHDIVSDLATEDYCVF